MKEQTTTEINDTNKPVAQPAAGPTQEVNTTENIQNKVSFLEPVNRNSKKSFYKRFKIEDTEEFKKASKIQKVWRGILLRRKLKERLKRYIFGKSLLAYVRRFKRKMVKKPTFRSVRDNYAFMYNIRINIDKLIYIQKFMKAKCEKRKERRELIGKLFNTLVLKRWMDGFKSIRNKNPNGETMKRLHQVYSEKFLNCYSKASVSSHFRSLIKSIKDTLDMKKNNFVFNYLAYSFEKGLKFYMVKWKRIQKKIALEEFYLHQDDEDDVVDIAEERKKIAQLKENSLIVRKFRNIAYKNLRSKFSNLKDNFFKWRDTTMRLKILALKQKKILSNLENKRLSIKKSSSIKEDIKIEEGVKQLIEQPSAPIKYKRYPHTSLTTVNINNDIFKKIQEVTKEFKSESKQRLFSTETIIYEILRRYSEWRPLKNKDLNLVVEEGDLSKKMKNLPSLKFTIEDDQIDYLKSIKTKNYLNYSSLQIFRKKYNHYVSFMKLWFYRWKMNIQKLKINESLDYMQNDIKFLIKSQDIKDSFITLKLSSVPEEEKSQESNGNVIVPILYVKDDDEPRRDRKMIEEEIDDYYHYALKNLEISNKKVKEKNLKTLKSSRTWRKSKIDLEIEGEEFIDEEEEDIHNEFLKQYRKRVEKNIPNDEEDIDDENRRNIVNYDDFEEDEDDKIKNEMTFEERMAMKKDQKELNVELIKENEDDLDLNCEVFDVETLVLLAKDKLAKTITLKNYKEENDPHKQNQTNVVSEQEAHNNQNINQTITENTNNVDLQPTEIKDIPLKTEELEKIDEAEDSDVSLDEIRNLKKQQKKERNSNIFNEKTTYNVGPRYMEFYHRSQSKVEAPKTLDNTKLMKVVSFSKKMTGLIKKPSSFKENQ